MSVQLPDTRWMTRPAVTTVIDALEGAGGTVRFVGGCVRDCFMGRPVGEIDLCVDREPDTVLAALETGNIRAVPTGIEHGTLTAVVDGEPVEVTSLRRDVETDGRRAVVSFTTDFREDSLRRDFTINALYADRTGAVSDFHGGLSDLAAQRLRFIGDPAARIEEDHLRVLRFYRFHAQLDFPVPDGPDRAACRDRRKRLKTLSAERVARELRRLLAAADPCPALDAMIADRILDDWLPEARGTDVLKRLIGIEDGADAMLRLAALTHGTDGSERIARRLKLSNAEGGRLRVLGGTEPPPRDAAAARRLIHALGATAARDMAILGRAQGQDDWTVLSDLAEHWSPPAFPVQGRDILAFGIAAGPDVGRILKTLETQWIDSDFTLTRAALLERGQEFVDREGGTET